MIASFMRVFYPLVFLQSKCTSAMRRILSTAATHMRYFFMCLCVGMKTLHNTLWSKGGQHVDRDRPFDRRV